MIIRFKWIVRLRLYIIDIKVVYVSFREYVFNIYWVILNVFVDEIVKDNV